MVFLFILSFPPVTVFSEENNPGDHHFAFSHQGSSRSYFVHVPSSYDPQIPVPVVIAFHGGGGNGKNMMAVSGLNATSDQHGFLVVYPEGTGRVRAGKLIGTWNAGRCCGAAMRNDVDDVGFIFELINRVIQGFHADPERIYLVGLSNGSQMTFRAACELSERIAAVSGVASPGVFDGCDPQNAVPVIYFHSVEDPCAPYVGGTGGGCFQEYTNALLGLHQKAQVWAVDSAAAYIGKWAAWNNVSGKPRVTYQGKDISCETWGDNAVTFCTMRDVGHAWPGGTHGPVCASKRSRSCRLYEDVVGASNEDIPGNELMWKFFSTHALRSR